MKTGYKWKSTEGISKGKFFKITELTPETVVYKSEESGKTYTAERKHFEKYIERVNKYWAERNKKYKNKKERLNTYENYQ